MVIVGLTGGIGSGKSTIARFFQDFGIPVYTADDEAKKLMVSDSSVKRDIIALLGDQSYQDGKLNRKYIAKQVFGNKALLERLNSIVHPAVKKDFNKWVEIQSAPYVIKEVAILFENNGHKLCDYSIIITAPESIRIDRVVKRDQVTENDVLRRMAAQWSDNRKIALADARIENNNLQASKEATLRIHNHLLRRIKQGW